MSGSRFGQFMPHAGCVSVNLNVHTSAVFDYHVGTLT